MKTLIVKLLIGFIVAYWYAFLVAAMVLLSPFYLLMKIGELHGRAERCQITRA